MVPRGYWVFHFIIPEMSFLTRQYFCSHSVKSSTILGIITTLEERLAQLLWRRIRCAWRSGWYHPSWIRSRGSFINYLLLICQPFSRSSSYHCLWPQYLRLVLKNFKQDDGVAVSLKTFTWDGTIGMLLERRLCMLTFVSNLSFVQSQFSSTFAWIFLAVPESARMWPLQMHATKQNDAYWGPWVTRLVFN